MIDERYLPTTLEGALLDLIEECTEVRKATCKCLRQEITGRHPSSRVVNWHDLLSKWRDLDRARTRLWAMISTEIGADIEDFN
jgi:hypothetical protein